MDGMLTLNIFVACTVWPRQDFLNAVGSKGFGVLERSDIFHRLEENLQI